MAHRIPQDIDFESYYRRVGIQESQDLHWGSYWRDKLIERLEYGVVEEGLELPWPKMRGSFRVRLGELTIWAGEDGHKKSLIVGQAMLWLARKQPVCVMSLEMQPEITLERMCRQAAGCQPSAEYIDQFARWTDNRIALYDQLDTVPGEKILGVIYYAFHELGCQQIVVDSLMKCGHAIDDYAEQVKFVDLLSRTAKALNVHIHLVHHMKKPGQGDNQGKARIHGSSQMINHAHNVITVWFNERRLEAKQAEEQGRGLTPQQETELKDGFDQVLTIRKQRNGIPYRAFGFHFDERSLQLTEHEGQRTTFRLDGETEPGPQFAPPLRKPSEASAYVPGTDESPEVAGHA